MKNVTERLRSHYGSRSELKLDKGSRETTAKIKMPLSARRASVAV